MALFSFGYFGAVKGEVNDRNCVFLLCKIPLPFCSTAERDRQKRLKERQREKEAYRNGEIKYIWREEKERQGERQ